MDDIMLIKPCEKYLGSYLEACRELKEMNIDAVAYHDPDKYDEWKDSFFKKMEDQSKGIGLPEGYVPCTTYWLVDGSNFIGRGSIRHHLNDFLKKYGGHIGYFIRKDCWNMGYGTLQLRLLLEKAHELGIEKALLTCDANNIASARVTEKTGGIKIGEAEVEVEGKIRSILRYEIETHGKDR